MNKKALIILNIALLVIAAIVVCLILGVGAEASAWQEQYDLGVRYYSEGNYEAAVLAFRAAIDLDPSRPEAYQGAAQAYIALGDEDAAARILKTGHSNTGDSAMEEWLNWYEDRQTAPETSPARPEAETTAPVDPEPTQPPETEATEPPQPEPAETEPVRENRFLTEEEAKAIASAYWGAQTGDTDLETGFVLAIEIQGGPTESDPKYIVALRWLVDDGTAAWWSTIDRIGIDAYTGAIVAPN